MKRVIVTYGFLDPLNLFSEHLIKGFEKLGYEAFLLDFSNFDKIKEQFSEFLKEPVNACIGFNFTGIKFSLMDGRNFWETSRIPFISILVDPPFSLSDWCNNASENTILLCIDREHLSYVSRFMKHISIAGFLPHGGIQTSNPIKPLSERKMDILYAGAITNDPLEGISIDEKNYDFDVMDVVTCIFERLITNAHLELPNATEEILSERKISLSETELNQFINEISLINYAATSYYRERIVKAAAKSGYDVYIYGGGWEAHQWTQWPNVHLMGYVSPQEVIDLIADAKVLLNTTPLFRNGAHERIFNGMLNGTLVVSDNSAYLKENLDDYIFMHEANDFNGFTETVSQILNNVEFYQDRANRAREFAEENSTWEARAAELARDLIDPYL